MMVKPLDLGFIGGGASSAVGYAHFAASTMDGRWRLGCGSFGTTEEANQLAASRYTVSQERTYLDYRDMLFAEKGRLSAVSVLTPTPLHFPIVRQCLEQGIPVICEKALGRTSVEAETLAQLARSGNTPLAVVYNYSTYPMVQVLREMVRQGDLGEVHQVQVEMPQEGYLREDESGVPSLPQAWRLEDGPIPTIHLDLGVHLHHLVYILTSDKPVSVTCSQSTNGRFPVVDTVSILCRYSSGMEASFWYTKAALGERNGLRVRLYGSKGSAIWVQESPEDLFFCSATGRREILGRRASDGIANPLGRGRFKPGHPAGFIEALANYYVTVADALTAGSASAVPLSDYSGEVAAEGLRVLEAAVRSAVSGHWETIAQQTPLPSGDALGPDD